MMTNLFSMFEPTSSLICMNFNWFMIFTPILFLFHKFWTSTSRITTLTKLIYKKLNPLSSKKPPLLMFFSSLIFIYVMNTLSLFPYLFGATTHILLSLSLALMFWSAVVMYGWTVNFGQSLKHLIPVGTPPWLKPMMVVIEIISLLIRPITLSVRLAANMSAGHILIALISSAAAQLPSLSLFAMMIMQILLMFLEIAVALIQSYVFVTLTALYYDEVNYA